MSKKLQEQDAQTPLFGANAGAIEALYQQYIADPSSVAPGWRDYFDGLDDAATEIAHSEIRHRLRQAARNGGPGATQSRTKAGTMPVDGEKQAAVSRLIQVYSLRGHQIANIDPLGLMKRPVPGVLKRDYLGLTEADMDTEFYTGGLAGTGNKRMKLRDILDLLQKIYCGRIGAEFAQVSRARERLWLRKRFEAGMASDPLTDEDRLAILEQLTSAEGIERYLHTRYVGQKRFSLEGGRARVGLRKGGLRAVFGDLLNRSPRQDDVA
jgi:2-oxoglutarate dehydrogenase E1 component